MKLEWNGKAFCKQAGWHLEFDADQAAQLEALKRVDARLCSEATVCKTKEGQLFLQWRERHPEMLSFFEFFGNDSEGCDHDDSRERKAEYMDLLQRLPYTDQCEVLSWAETFQLVLYFFGYDEATKAVETL